MAFEPKLFNYPRMFGETLKPGAVYWPGEAVMKFGLQRGNIVPVMVGDRKERFEWGEIVALDSDGKARKVEGTDSATNFFGIVDRNASGTYGVLDTQVMGMAPRLTLSVFTGGRDGTIAVPVQNVVNHLVADPATTDVAVDGQVYVRVKSLGEEASDWSNDSVEYKVGAIVKNSDVLYICIKNHTSSADDADTPGHDDASDKWSTDIPELPIGGIETVDNDETTAWTNVKFTETVMFPFAEEKYAPENGLTNAVSAIKL